MTPMVDAAAALTLAIAQSPEVARLQSPRAREKASTNPRAIVAAFAHTSEHVTRTSRTAAARPVDENGTADQRWRAAQAWRRYGQNLGTARPPQTEVGVLLDVNA